MRIYPKGSIQPGANQSHPESFSTMDPVAAMMLTSDAAQAAETSGMPIRRVIERLQEHQAGALQR